MPQPPVSVIITSYNHADYIASAIRSVIDQTYKQLEIIIIDDGSSDNSPDIIAGFSDPRISFIQNPENLGACATLNKGIKAATGEFIAILNSDDLYLPGRIQRLVEIAGQTQYEFLASGVDLIDESGDLIRDKGHWWHTWVNRLRNHLAASGDIVQTLLAGNFFISTSNFFIRRGVFDRIGLFNDYRYTPDYEFILRYLADNPQGIHCLCDEYLLRYRLHGHNTILEQMLNPRKETFEILNRWFPELLENRLDRQRFTAMEGQFENMLDQLVMDLEKQRHQDIERLRLSLTKRETYINKLSENNHRLHHNNFSKTLEIANLKSSLKDAQHQKAQEISRLQQQRQQLEIRLQAKTEELALTRQSRSFRLGYALLHPTKQLLNLFKPG